MYMYITSVQFLYYQHRKPTISKIKVAKLHRQSDILIDITALEQCTCRCPEATRHVRSHNPHLSKASRWLKIHKKWIYARIKSKIRQKRTIEQYNDSLYMRQIIKISTFRNLRVHAHAPEKAQRAATTTIIGWPWKHQDYLLIIVGKPVVMTEDAHVEWKFYRWIML